MRRPFAVIALAGALVAQAHEPVYRWGPPATNDFTERRVERLLDLGDQGFVLLRVSQDATTVKHFWLERFDRTLASVGMREVAFNGGVMGDSYDLDEVLTINGKLYAFVTHWEKAAGKHTLLLHPLDPEGVLAEGQVLDVVMAEKMGNNGRFIRALSPDGSKLLVLTELPFEKGTKERLRMTCYATADRKVIWKHEQTLEWEADKGLHNHVAVDDAGRAYLFKKTWQKPVWRYALYATDGKGSWKAHPANQLEGKELTDHRIAIGADGACFVYALYTTEPSAYVKKVHGSWYAGFAADGSLEVDLAKSWPADMVALFSGDRIANDAAKSHVDDLRIKEILHRDDGKLLLLLEQVESKSSAVAGSSPMQFTYEWNYGDVLALCVEPTTGVPVWWQNLDKRQEVRSSTAQDEFGSFVYALKQDRLYILWNNTDLSVPSIPAANWTEPDGTRYVKHKAFDSNTVHATFMQVIEPDGKLAYADRTFGLPLFHLHEGAVFEMSMTTPFFFDLNGDLVVLAMMHNGGKRYRFGAIAL